MKIQYTEVGGEVEVGDEVHVSIRGAAAIAATVMNIDWPDCECYGYVIVRDADGSEFTCDPEDFKAEFVDREGNPLVFNSNNRDDFDSGRWTDDDTRSMDAGRDHVMCNDAGEPMY